uniref:Carboxylesterase type B domain-containing protein n=1 Tax=Clastoptera arizonana TaxID=38151 RepID=A0A1B6C6P7_9HEMI
MILFGICLFLCWATVVLPRDLPPGRVIIDKTRIIETKEGKLQGLVVQIEHNPNLRPVDTFLGVPYAAAPTGNQRFMPPGSPPQWSGLKMADSYSHVCPQAMHRTRDLSKKPMSRARADYLARLSSFMQTQSEDCLYLNIYAPHEEQGPFLNQRSKVPVIVYIHGESFEWNSGNPYDGSILASFGDVIVVTINFRLGILGFLKPGAGDNTPSNFGLLDQLAALQWVRDNIAEFGGDSTSVTLMGHDTGAACINYLMVSPVAQGVTGLFHRAIVMSGTALADWALVTNPLQFTIQVAQALNCPQSSEEMGDCLRRKRLHEIMAVDVYAPDFKTPFGPVIDGTVVPNEPSKVMGTYNNLFSRYQMLYGLTEVESYHLLDAVSLAHGMLEEDQQYMLRNYLQARFELLPDVALAKTTQQYTTWLKSSAIDHRNNILEVLSDARVAAPIIQMANYHSQANNNSYFYVFKHISKFGAYPNAEFSVNGEELPYVFGVPLDSQSSHFQTTYSVSEKLLSEVIMTMWTNFAKYGNPKAKSKFKYLNQGPREWLQYNIGWPKYNNKTQAYYSLGIPPEIKSSYRRDKMNFWNFLLPSLLTNPDYQPIQPKITSWVTPKPPWVYVNTPPVRQYAGVLDRGRGKYIPDYQRIPKTTSSPYHVYTSLNKYDSNQGIFDTPNDPPPTEGEANIISTASSLTLTIIIFVGICFLLFNLCAFVGLYYQRDKLRVRDRLANVRYGCNLGNEEEGEETEDQYTKKEEENVLQTPRDLKNTEIKSILKSSEGMYEQIRAPSGKSSSGRKWTGIPRQASSSTVTIDPHTKVKEWIAQEVVQRCSPRFLRKSKKADRKVSSVDIYSDQMSNQTVNSSKVGSTISKMGLGINTMNRQNVQKISVAVDATPATRSASVLQQTPIELTKSLDEGKNSNGLGSIKASTSLVTILKRPSLQRTDAFTSDGSSDKLSSSDTGRKTSSINLKLSSDSIPTVIHLHSVSDPVVDHKLSTSRLDNIHLRKTKEEALYSQVKKSPNKNQKSFGNVDVNVTSRDDVRSDNSHCSHEETLDHIKRRNFPKVLPDFPDDGDEFQLNKAVKRRSLPLSSHLNTKVLCTDDYEDIIDDDSQYLHLSKIPPAPPPRVSTLGRKPSNTLPVLPLSTSQLSVTLKGSTSSNQKSQVPIPIKIPQVPILSSPIKPSLSPVTKLENPSQKRTEPKVIIKPTTTNPIMSKDNKTIPGSNIPRVTHHITPPSPKFGSNKNVSKIVPQNKLPDMGMGKRTKITPVKKTASTEAALDTINAGNTKTIKRNKRL